MSRRSYDLSHPKAEQAFCQDYYEVDIVHETNKAICLPLSWDDTLEQMGLGSEDAWIPKRWLNEEGLVPGWALVKKLRESAISVGGISDTLDRVLQVSGCDPDAPHFPLKIGGIHILLADDDE